MVSLSYTHHHPFGTKGGEGEDSFELIVNPSSKPRVQQLQCGLARVRERERVRGVFHGDRVAPSHEGRGLKERPSRHLLEGRLRRNRVSLSFGKNERSTTASPQDGVKEGGLNKSTDVFLRWRQ